MSILNIPKFFEACELLKAASSAINNTENLEEFNRAIDKASRWNTSTVKDIKFSRVDNEYVCEGFDGTPIDPTHERNSKVKAILNGYQDLIYATLTYQEGEVWRINGNLINIFMQTVKFQFLVISVLDYTRDNRADLEKVSGIGKRVFDVVVSASNIPSLVEFMKFFSSTNMLHENFSSFKVDTALLWNSYSGAADKVKITTILPDVDFGQFQTQEIEDVKSVIMDRIMGVAEIYKLISVFTVMASLLTEVNVSADPITERIASIILALDATLANFNAGSTTQILQRGHLMSGSMIGNKPQLKTFLDSVRQFFEDYTAAYIVQPVSKDWDAPSVRIEDVYELSPHSPVASPIRKYQPRKSPSRIPRVSTTEFVTNKRRKIVTNEKQGYDRDSATDDMVEELSTTVDRLSNIDREGIDDNLNARLIKGLREANKILDEPIKHFKDVVKVLEILEEIESEWTLVRR